MNNFSTQSVVNLKAVTATLPDWFSSQTENNVLPQAVKLLFTVAYAGGMVNSFSQKGSGNPWIQSKPVLAVVQTAVYIFATQVIPASWVYVQCALLGAYAYVVVSSRSSHQNTPKVTPPKVVIPQSNVNDINGTMVTPKDAPTQADDHTAHFWQEDAGIFGPWYGENNTQNKPQIAPPAPTPELQERQEKYQFSYSKRAHSPFLDKMNWEQEPTAEYLAKFGLIGVDILSTDADRTISATIRHLFSINNVRSAVHAGLVVLGLREPYRRPTILADYVNQLYSDPSKVPSVGQLDCDAAFCRWRLAGPNPIVIKPCTDLSPFMLPVTHGHTPTNIIRSAHTDQRLYWVDYRFMADMQPADATRFTIGAMALFETPADRLTRQRQSIIPLCIQLNSASSEPQIVFPNEGRKWEIAKTIFSSLDGDYHEGVVHLGDTHLVMESFMVGTYRQLPAEHPLFKLLSPHFEGTAWINNLANETLINPDAIFSDLVSVKNLISQKIEDFNQLAGNAAINKMSQDFTFPELIRRRGMDHEGFNAPYPYRDDGMLIWNAVRDWVEEYVAIYYKNDNDVRGDERLVAWINEMRVGGMCAWFNSFDYTKNMLVEVLSAVVYCGSAGHASVNYPQRTLMQYTPAWPLRLDNTIPIAENPAEADYVSYLPDIPVAQTQAKLGFFLGGIYYTRLGYYAEDHFNDIRVDMALRNFQNALDEVTLEINRRNERRVAVWGDDPFAQDYAYTVYLPEKIPQSVNV